MSELSLGYRLGFLIQHSGVRILLDLREDAVRDTVLLECIGLQRQHASFPTLHSSIFATVYIDVAW